MNSKTPLPPRHGQRKRTVQPKRKMATWLKVLLSVLLIVLLAIIAYAGYILKYGYDKLDDISTISSTGDQTKDVNPALKPNKEPFSFILLGIDYRPELPGKRTDVIIAGAIHPVTKEAVLVSLPRDTYFEVPGYQGDKLNHFYPKFFELQERGKLDSASPEDEMKVMLGKYLDMEFDHVAVLNFQGFVDIVDALGGIEVNVDQDMCYRDNADGTNINLKAGFQELDGQQALDFVRYRKSSPNCKPMTKGTTDADRNVRQNAVLHELVSNMQSLGTVTKVTKMIDAVADNFKLDMTPDQMTSSIMTYMDINPNDIHYISVDGEWISPYIYVDEAKLEEGKQALKKVMNGESLKSPVQDETATNSDGNSGSGN
ncbi:LCP family protein [Paenibacillus marinisediminis]